jgi:hypothetical protein
LIRPREKFRRERQTDLFLRQRGETSPQTIPQFTIAAATTRIGFFRPERESLM